MLPSPTNNPETADNVLINAWLLNDKNPCTPLEFTLKVRAVYAGDALGPSQLSSIEAYIRRMSHSIPGARLAIENLASQALQAHKPYFKAKEAQSWVADYEPAPQPVQESQEIASQITEKSEQSPEAAMPARVSKILPGLIENGLIQTHADDSLSFVHPVILSYLAGIGLRSNPVREFFGNRSIMGNVGTDDFICSCVAKRVFYRQPAGRKQ